MIVDQAKRLISLGMRATRMDDAQTKKEVRKLVKSGLVEAKYAAKLARAVINEADRERKVLGDFLMKEYAKEMKKAAPHAKVAAARGKKLVNRVVRTARKIQKAAAKTRNSTKRGMAKARAKKRAARSRPKRSRTKIRPTRKRKAAQKMRRR
ncbi:MAG: hypothetical protein AABX47_00010 [Nanoarchaeota archaeon]